MITPATPLALIIAYFIGAIPFALLVARRIGGVDVRRVGSGNVGAMNTFRSAGRTAGVLVAVLDGIKGAVAMLIGRWLVGPEVAVLCGAAAVAGHCFSPYLIWATRAERGGGWKMGLRRSGGKGLATGLTVLALADWRVGLVALAIFALAKLILRTDVTWPTVIAVAIAPLVLWLLTGNVVTTIAVLIVGLLVIVKHLPDIRTGFYVDQLT